MPVKHGDAKQSISGGNAVEEDRIEAALAIEFGQQARVVEEALLNLRFGLGTGRLVSPGRGGDRVAKRDRLRTE